MTTIDVDIVIENWTVAETLGYRAATGTNPEAALRQMQIGFLDGQDEARRVFGDKIDEEGWEAPVDWLPSAMFEMDARYLLGFAWVPWRRANGGFPFTFSADDARESFGAFSQEVVYSKLMTAFFEALAAVAKEAEAAPLENREQRRRSTPASKKGSPSARGPASLSRKSQD